MPYSCKQTCCPRLAPFPTLTQTRRPSLPVLRGRHNGTGLGRSSLWCGRRCEGAAHVRGDAAPSVARPALQALSLSALTSAPEASKCGPKQSPARRQPSSGSSKDFLRLFRFRPRSFSANRILGDFRPVKAHGRCSRYGTMWSQPPWASLW